MMDHSAEALKEMKAFYKKDDPTEEEQFRFVEAMKYLIETAYFEADLAAFSYNLAMYYRNIREFQLEKKYLETGVEAGGALFEEQLGLIWYYGLCGEQNFEEAYRYFTQSGTRRSRCMLADMARLGQYIPRDDRKCRAILEDLIVAVEPEREDHRFRTSTLFPEIALRLVRLNIEEGKNTEFDLDCLLDARDILIARQRFRPFWGNLRTMRDILEATEMMTGDRFDFADLYDLLVFKEKQAVITFCCNGETHRLEIIPVEKEFVYQYKGKWFHGAEDYLEKARIGSRRITSVCDLISDIRVLNNPESS